MRCCLNDALVAAYASLFVHRWDSYAVQQRNGAYWRVAEPLMFEHIQAHLQGRWTLGTYLLDVQSTCTFAVFDADSEDGLMWIAVLAGELARQGIPTLVEASRRGGHLWIHFVESTPASVVRAWLLPYAQAFGMELYPKQDALAASGSGSLIRLPLGIHRRSGGWYPFVQFSSSWDILPVGQTVVECCVWATQNVERVRVPQEVMVVAAPEEQRQETVVVAPSPSHSRVVGTIRHWCLSQNIVEVIGLYVSLNEQGIGSCPFKEHHAHGDMHPSFQVFGGDDPHWYCYAWQRAGNVFDFLCLYHNFSAQEGWQRLQGGILQ